MKAPEVVILSGKGGTGKTSVAAAFASLAERPVVVDCDVDAPDLDLVLGADVRARGRFTSGWVASISPALCRRCGRCAAECRFHAVVRLEQPRGAWRIDDLFCEGCGACELACPSRAISMEPADRGEWLRSDTRVGPMLHARMRPGAENSGKLVALLRRKGQEIANEMRAGVILCDGPPGIGCPAIATLSGAEHVLFVTEPSLTGLHDLERAADLAARFRVPGSVFINNSDIDRAQAHGIARAADERGLTVIGSAPYDQAFTSAQLAGLSVIEHGDGAAARSVREAWVRLIETLASRRARRPTSLTLRAAERTTK